MSLNFGDYAVAFAILLYLVIAIAYLITKDKWQCIYYLAAAVLNIAVLMMKVGRK